MKKNFNTPQEEFEKLLAQIECDENNENQKHKKCPLDSYEQSINLLKEFVDKVNDLLNITKHYNSTQKQINTLNSIKKSYMNIVYSDNPVMTAKVKYVQETLKILKKQELSNIPCYENTEIFNLLNDEDYTHFSDVIDWIPQARDSEEPAFNLAVQKKLCNSIEKTVYDNRLTLQQLNYLSDDLETYKRMLKVEKDYLHKKIEKLTERINSLKEELTGIQLRQKNRRDDITLFIDSQSDETVALIFAFCSQLSLFDVVSIDQISGKSNPITIFSPKPSAYSYYIKKWTQQLTYTNSWRVK